MNIYARIISNDDEIKLGFKGLYGAQFYSGVDPLNSNNKVMKITTVNTAHRVSSTTNIAGNALCSAPNAFIFNMRHYFETVPWFYSRKLFTIELRGKAGRPIYFLDFELADGELGSHADELLIRTPDGEEIKGLRLKSGSWYGFRMEYYQDQKNPKDSHLKLFIDGERTQPSTTVELSASGNAGVITCVAMVHYATKTRGTQYFDDISFTMTEKHYREGTPPIELDPSQIKLYDFESGLPSDRDFNIDMILKKIDEIIPVDPSQWMTDAKSTPLRHSHEFYEIMTVVKGSGKFFADDDEIEISEGSIIAVAPGVVHGIVSDATYKIISVSGRFDKLSCIGSKCVIRDNSKEEGKKLAEMILYNRFGNEDYLNSLCDVFLKFILLNVDYTVKNTTQSIYKIISQMEKGFANSDMSVGKLLDGSGYTKDYIRNEFLTVTKMTPKKYLTAIRMKNAKAMLDLYGSELSIGEIAERCGILDPSVFSRIFKKYYGISPTEYREKKK